METVEAGGLPGLLEVMRRLRDPDQGCPWDREQNFDSIAPYTIEEAYEVADAIERGDSDDLCQELGDLLFQVVFHAQMASELALFDFNDVTTAIVEKMTRRHPHVFAGEKIDSAQAQTAAWDAHKEAERRERAEGTSAPGGSRMDGVTRGLPTMRRALKLQKAAAKAGLDWPELAGVIDKLREETDEFAQAVREPELSESRGDEIGDLLFTCVNLARHAGVEPDAALRRANGKFERRFRRVEQLLAQAGTAFDDSNAAELDGLWQQAKAEGL